MIGLTGRPPGRGRCARRRFRRVFAGGGAGEEALGARRLRMLAERPSPGPETMVLARGVTVVWCWPNPR